MIAIVITGFATKQTAETVMNKGAVEFLAKPFKLSQLKKILSVISGTNS